MIRVENKDFTDFKETSPIIFVSDYNFLELSNAEDFLREYKDKYDIRFLYPLFINSEETFKKFYSIINLSTRRLIINFKFSNDFFKKYYYKNGIVFSSEPLQEEINASIFLQRILKMILYAKSQKEIIFFTRNIFNSIEIKKQPLLQLWQYIYNWSYKKDNISCYDYLLTQMDNKVLENLTNNKTNLRLLLKQKPNSFNIQNIDFFEK